MVTAATKFRILYHCAVPANKFGHPSWTPDWTYFAARIEIYEYLYSVALATDMKITFNAQGHTLSIQVFTVSQVCALGPVLRGRLNYVDIAWPGDFGMSHGAAKLLLQEMETLLSPSLDLEYKRANLHESWYDLLDIFDWENEFISSDE
jgi:hypothetical protein